MKRHLILLAEDDLSWGKMCEADLRMYGYEVVWAQNGWDALDLYEKHTPDLVLLDIIMPGQNGYYVAREIRKKDRSTPIVFLTSSEEMDDIEKGLDIGVTAYLKKHITLEELLLRIKIYIKQNPVNQHPLIEITRNTTLNLVTQELTCCGKSKRLPPRECNLLQTLVAYKNVPQNRDGLTLRIYGNAKNNIDYMNKGISLLRKSLAADKHIKFVVNRGSSVTLEIIE